LSHSKQIDKGINRNWCNIIQCFYKVHNLILYIVHHYALLFSFIHEVLNGFLTLVNGFVEQSLYDRHTYNLSQYDFKWIMKTLGVYIVKKCLSQTI